MLEVGWSELLVIAIILIVVVGPKDLPAMMRTFGKMMGRVRTMANEFRGQFDEAMREAELDEVRKGLGEVNKYNPASSLRDAINPIRQLGQDIKSDLQKTTDIAAKPKADAGTPVAELASDPALEPEPAKADGAAGAATPSKPVPLASAPVPAAAKSADKPSARKKPAAVEGDYPPPAKKVVKRKPTEPHVEHDVHIVPAAARPAARTTKKIAAAAVAEPVAMAVPTAKAKPAPKKQTGKAGDA